MHSHARALMCTHALSHSRHHRHATHKSFICFSLIFHKMKRSNKKKHPSDFFAAKNFTFQKPGPDTEKVSSALIYSLLWIKHYDCSFFKSCDHFQPIILLKFLRRVNWGWKHFSIMESSSAHRSKVWIHSRYSRFSLFYLVTNTLYRI